MSQTFVKINNFAMPEYVPYFPPGNAYHLIPPNHAVSVLPPKTPHTDDLIRAAVAVVMAQREAKIIAAAARAAMRA